MPKDYVLDPSPLHFPKPLRTQSSPVWYSNRRDSAQILMGVLRRLYRCAVNDTGHPTYTHQPDRHSLQSLRRQSGGTDQPIYYGPSAGCIADQQAQNQDIPMPALPERIPGGA
jgi:hypothetical protein